MACELVMCSRHVFETKFGALQLARLHKGPDSNVELHGREFGPKKKDSPQAARIPLVSDV